MPRLLSLALLLLSPLAASASSIRYDIDESFQSVTEVGTITTDGATGVLTGSDILGFDIVVTDADGSARITGILGSATVNGTDLLATASGLYFDFNAAAGEYFDLSNFSGATQVCFGACVNPYATRLAAFVKNGSVIESAPRLGVEEIASPETVAATPEPSGLALLGTGVLGVAGVVRRRVFKA